MKTATLKRGAAVNVRNAVVCSSRRADYLARQWRLWNSWPLIEMYETTNGLPLPWPRSNLFVSTFTNSEKSKVSWCKIYEILAEPFRPHQSSKKKKKKERENVTGYFCTSFPLCIVYPFYQQYKLVCTQEDGITVPFTFNRVRIND